MAGDLLELNIARSPKGDLAPLQPYLRVRQPVHSPNPSQFTQLTVHHLCVSGSSPILAISLLKSSKDVLLMYRMCATRRCVVVGGGSAAVFPVEGVDGMSGSSKWLIE
jgi:hypothetical protein